MSLDATHISEDNIHKYVDECLSPEEANAFKQLMEEDTELANKVAAYQLQKSLLHELYDPVLDEEVPASISAKPPSRQSQKFLLNMAASILLISTGVILGWSLRDNTIEKHSVIVKLVQPAAAAHVVYVPEVKHPVEVAADQEQHLVKWLSKRLGNTIKAPSLTDYGYHLVGGRLLPAKRGAAAQFMYEDEMGERLTLYVQSIETVEKNSAFRFFEDDKTKSFYWIDGDLGYVLSGTISKPRLLNTAHSVYQQLSF